MEISSFERVERTASQPKAAGCPERERTSRSRYRAHSAGKKVQRRYLKKHERSQHDGVRQRRHACPFCTAEICKTYSTFQDWKNHLHTTYGQCMEDDDPLDREEYAAGFKLDRWERFHHIKGDETDRAYLRMADTGVKYGGSRRDHHLPSAFRTLRVRHPTEK